MGKILETCRCGAELEVEGNTQELQIAQAKFHAQHYECRNLYITQNPTPKTPERKSK